MRRAFFFVLLFAAPVFAQSYQPGTFKPMRPGYISPFGIPFTLTTPEFHLGSEFEPTRIVVPQPVFQNALSNEAPRPEMLEPMQGDGESAFDFLISPVSGVPLGSMEDRSISLGEVAASLRGHPPASRTYTNQDIDSLRSR